MRAPALIVAKYILAKVNHLRAGSYSKALAEYQYVKNKQLLVLTEIDRGPKIHIEFWVLKLFQIAHY